MGPLRDADGTVIGAGGCGRHVCTRSAFDRRKFKCQTAAMDSLRSDQLPMCPKTQAFRERTCEITWDGKSGKVGDKTMGRPLTAAERKTVNDALRRHGITLARDATVGVPLLGAREVNPTGRGLQVDDDGYEMLRQALEELGIQADDIEKVIARLSGEEAVDAAPSNMGSGNTAGELTGGREDAGGGSTRTYAPTESGNYGMDRRGARDARRPMTAMDARRYEERFPNAGRLHGGMSLGQAFGTDRIRQAD